MASYRLTKKRQTTIPKEICTFLHVDAGDSVSFAVEDDRVVVYKSSQIDLEYLESASKTLESEWLSQEDSNAYDDL